MHGLNTKGTQVQPWKPDIFQFCIMMTSKSRYAWLCDMVFVMIIAFCTHVLSNVGQNWTQDGERLTKAEGLLACSIRTVQPDMYPTVGLCI